LLRGEGGAGDPFFYCYCNPTLTLEVTGSFRPRQQPRLAEIRMFPRPDSAPGSFVPVGRLRGMKPLNTSPPAVLVLCGCLMEFTVFAEVRFSPFGRSRGANISHPIYIKNGAARSPSQAQNRGAPLATAPKSDQCIQRQKMKKHRQAIAWLHRIVPLSVDADVVGILPSVLRRRRP